jgi:hypothetical protein
MNQKTSKLIRRYAVLTGQAMRYRPMKRTWNWTRRSLRPLLREQMTRMVEATPGKAF